MWKARFGSALTCCFLLSLACDNRKTERADPQARAPEPVKKTVAQTDSQIAKIVFVGQKQACDCTRERVEKTWNALQQALAKRKDVAVERIQRDVDQRQAEALAEIRPMMIAPGLYFFDVNEHLVELLQGELTAEQIEKAL